MADFEALRSRLATVAESVSEAALEELRSALALGQRGRVDRERKLTHARRAIEKAIHLLEQLDGTDAGDGDDV